MSASSRSRHRRKLEPITVEELANTAGMSGFCTFLTRGSDIAVPILDQIAATSAVGPRNNVRVLLGNCIAATLAATNTPRNCGRHTARNFP